MTDTEFNAVKAFLSAYRYTELDLRVRRAELTRLTARKEALILEGNTDLLFHLEHAICAAKDAIRVLCTRQAEIEAAIDTVESAALREILTQHYICALDLKEIAERMHYSDRHMRRLHRKAIESVSLSAVLPFKKRGSSPRTSPCQKNLRLPRQSRGVSFLFLNFGICSARQTPPVLPCRTAVKTETLKRS